ncbi:spirocyclase AveC family protein [Streptomyces sp. HC44]|uniref:Spirocyclase AveC family protein n=1 Tax=Streptomyces scabichelini TaxID=2711217 RepID=A0A6G4VF02_9ACTN|nr:spirocyclase AveC family protein [Streptomyces scabichelini]
MSGHTQRTARAQRRSAVRMVRPVHVWAAAGTLCLAAQLALLVRWLADRGYRLTGGPRPAAPATALVLQGLFSALCLAVLALLIRMAWRQCRAERRLSFDTAGIIGFLLATWLDPVQNYLRPVFVQNAYALTPAASWGPYLPGWQGSDPHTVTWLWLPLLPMYGAFYAAVILISRLMRRIRARHPQWSEARLYGASYLISYAAVAPLTQIYPLLAVGVWGHAIPELTLFSGRWYQWPLYEAPVTALVVLLPSILRHQHLTGGSSLVERGMEQLPDTRRSWARALAVTAFMNGAVLLYMLIQILLSLLPGISPQSLPAHFGTTF